MAGGAKKKARGGDWKVDKCTRMQRRAKGGCFWRAKGASEQGVGSVDMKRNGTTYVSGPERERDWSCTLLKDTIGI